MQFCIDNYVLKLLYNHNIKFHRNRSHRTKQAGQTDRILDEIGFETPREWDVKIYWSHYSLHVQTNNYFIDTDIYTL